MIKPFRIFLTIIYFLLILTALLTALSLQVFALDTDTKKMITETSGVTDEDAKTALQKNEFTIFDIYALAVKNTERLKIEGENSIQAEYRQRQALGAFFPKLYLRGNQYFPVNDSKNYSSSQRTNISLYGRQPVITGLNEWSGLKGSALELKIKKYGLYYDAARLLLDVSSGFFNVIQIEKNIKNNEEILNLFKLTANELKRRVAIGRSRASEVQRTNSELYRLEATVKSLQSELTHARLILSTISNTGKDFNLIEGESLPDPAYKADDLKHTISNRWEVKIASEAAELAGINVIAAYGGYLPSAYIDGSYMLYQEKMPSGAPSSKARDYYFSLGVEIPLFSGGITTAKVKETESVKRQADLNLSSTIRLVEQDITDAYQNWESSANEVEAFKKALISAEQNYNTVKNEYRLNLVTILDVISSLKTLQSARDDYERTVLQNKFNRIRLGIAINEFTGKNIELLKVK